MLARYGDTRGMDHMRLHPMRTKPARQPEAVPTGFEGQCNPRDLAAGLDRLVAPAMQQAKQPFCTRLQLLAWLALNAGNHTGNQPTRLAHLDDGNDRAILVQGDEGPAQVVRLGHQGTPSVGYSDDGAISSPPAPYHLPVPRTTPGFWPISTRTTRRDRCRKNGVRIRQLLVCAALGREWWARRWSVLSVSDPRERAAREPAGADRAPSSPSSARCASNLMLPAPGCVSRRSRDR